MKKQLFLLLAFIAISTFAVFEPASLSAMAIMPVMGKLSVTEMENIAKKDFSSFEGDEYYGYTGEGDDFVDFGNKENGHFLNSEIRIFSMTITNSESAARPFYILPGLEYVPGRIRAITQDNSTKDITVSYPYGVPRDAAFCDTAGNSGLTGSGSPKTIERFFSFLMSSPIHCHQIKIQSNANANQIAQLLTVRALSPFKSLQEEIINPDRYLDQNSYQDKKVTFPVDLILSKDVQIEYSILSADIVTITFFCDSIMNQSTTFAKKISKAKGTFGQVLGSQKNLGLKAIK
jgi:hypothetical protein